ncbi:MAG: ribonuclease M5 [Candidatus Izemoplasma sp.]
MELNKKTFNEVIVVEGYHDLAKLKSIYPNVDIEITNGSTIDDERLKKLKLLNKERGLILFMDPDYQGERIRKIINEFVGETKHAFLKKHQCISKNKQKVGIEHANSSDIINGLDNVLTTNQRYVETVTMSDMYTLNLIGYNNSKKLRKKVGEALGIGLNNGKTLRNKFNMFNIKIESIIEIIEGE